MTTGLIGGFLPDVFFVFNRSKLCAFKIVVRKTSQMFIAISLKLEFESGGKIIQVINSTCGLCYVHGIYYMTILLYHIEYHLKLTETVSKMCKTQAKYRSQKFFFV